MNELLKMGRLQTKSRESKREGDKKQFQICDEIKDANVALSEMATNNIRLSRSKLKRFGDVLLHTLGKGFQEGHE